MALLLGLAGGRSPGPTVCRFTALRSHPELRRYLQSAIARAVDGHPAVEPVAPHVFALMVSELEGTITRRGYSRDASEGRWSLLLARQAWTLRALDAFLEPAACVGFPLASDRRDLTARLRSAGYEVSVGAAAHELACIVFCIGWLLVADGAGVIDLFAEAGVRADQVEQRARRRARGSG